MARVAAYGEWRRRAPGTVPALARRRSPQLARLIVERALERGGGWLTPVEAQRAARRGRHHGAAIDAGHVDRSRRWRRPRASDIRSRSRPSAPRCSTRPSTRRCGSTCRPEPRCGSRRPSSTRSLGDKMEGLLVQRMIGGGAEMMIGAINDPTFGHVIVCGSGGVLIELLADSPCRLYPVTDQDAAEMVAGAQGRAAPARVPRRAPARRGGVPRRRAAHLGARRHLPGNPGAGRQSACGTADGVSALDVRVRVAANAHRPEA